MLADLEGLLPTLRKLVRRPVPSLRSFRDFQETFLDWPQFCLTTMLGKPPVRAYRLRNGQKLWLRTRSIDFAIADEIMRQEVYTSGGCDIRPDDIVLDVGAHIGIFSILACRRASRGLVVALEPHPANFQLLLANLGLNGCRRALPLGFAVGAVEERRELFISSSNTGEHSFYTRSEESLEVRTITIEQVLERANLPKIDFLKMDCEGAEYEILQSIPVRILDSVRAISLEYHELSSRTNLGTLSNLLEEHGFTVQADQEHRILRAVNSKLPSAA